MEDDLNHKWELKHSLSPTRRLTIRIVPTNTDSFQSRTTLLADRNSI